MAAALIRKSVLKQPLSRGILSPQADALDALALQWTFPQESGNISAIIFEGVLGVLFADLA